MLRNNFIYSCDIKDGLYNVDFRSNSMTIRPIYKSSGKERFRSLKHIDTFTDLFQSNPNNVYYIKTVDEGVIEFRRVNNMRGEEFEISFKNVYGIDLNERSVRECIFNNYLFVSTLYEDIIEKETMDSIFNDGISSVLRKDKMELLKLIATFIANLSKAEKTILDNSNKIDRLIDLIDEFNITLSTKEKNRFMGFLNSNFDFFNFYYKSYFTTSITEENNKEINDKNFSLLSKFLFRIGIFSDSLYEFIVDDLDKKNNSYLYSTSISFILKYFFTLNDLDIGLVGADSNVLFNLMTYPNETRKNGYNISIKKLFKAIYESAESLDCYRVSLFQKVFNFIKNEFPNSINLSPVFIKFIEEDLYKMFDKQECEELANMFIENKELFYNSGVKMSRILINYIDCDSKEYKQFVFKEDLSL